MLGFLIAIASGVLMSLQGVFNTNVTKASSIWTAAGFVQLSAFFVCVLAWLINDRQNPLRVFSVTPKYMLLGGVMGALITITVVKSMERLGTANAIIVIVTAQTICGYLIELLGAFGVDKKPFCWQRCLGALLAIGGIVLFQCNNE